RQAGLERLRQAEDLRRQRAPRVSPTGSPIKEKVAIATGDPGGIGPEIALKAALDKRVRAICDPVIVGDRSALEAHARTCRIKLGNVEIAEVKARPFHIGDIDAEHGLAALDAARTAIEGALAGKYRAVGAAPPTEP